MTTRSDQATAELLKEGGAMDLGPEKMRLWNRIIRLLAQGSPVSRDRLQNAIAELGIEQEQADAFIGAWSERDDAGNIVGLGITYNPTAHRITIDGHDMWIWCAFDTLEAALILGKKIGIESAAPASNETVRLRAGPDGVSQVDPASAVITFPLRDSDQVDLSSTTAIWGSFCHHSFFFPSRRRAEQWVGGREDIEILTLDEGFALAREWAAWWLRYEQRSE